MSISDISRMRLAYIVEATFGVQVTGSNLQTLRLTSESLKQATDVITSREIRSDRQQAGVVRSKVSVEGAIDFELSYGTYDELMAAALMDSAWSSELSVLASGTASAVNSSNSFTHASAWTNTPTAGEWIEVRGFANAANNGYFKVESATGTTIVVSGGTLTDETDKSGVDIDQGASIVNGTNKDSFNFERGYTDLSNEFALYVGCMINQMSLNVGTASMVTGNLGIMGQLATSETASGGTGYDAVNTNEIMNSIDHVLGIYENGSAVNALDFNMSLANNLREQQKIGTLGPIGFGADALAISGTLTAYYESSTAYDKYLNFTTTSLAKVFEDTAGNAYIIDLPSVKLIDASRHAGAGLGDDFKVPFAFQAFRDSTEDVTVRIAKFAA